MHRFQLSVLLLLVFVITCCGQPKPQDATASPDSALQPTDAGSAKLSTKSTVETAPDTAQPAADTAAPASGPAPLVVTAAEGTAEAAFQQTLVAFQDGRLDAIYDFLPASHQADVEGVVHLFGEKMDGELWSKTFQILAKIANILKTKKSMILKLDIVQKSPRVNAIKPHWDGIAGGIYDVATSEVADVESLKRCDVKRLLSSGSQLLNGMPLPKFGNVSVMTVNSDANSATLSYRESKDGEAIQVEFVKVDGKWMPKSLADGWATTIDDIKSKLKNLPGIVTSIKPQMMQQLEQMNGSIEKMQEAKTPEEFNLAFFPTMLILRFTPMLIEQAMVEAALKSNKGQAIRVEINRELMDADQTKLKEVVLSALGDPTIEYEIIANDGKTRVRFNPVPDGDTVVIILQKHFADADVRHNSETKTILVELK